MRTFLIRNTAQLFLITALFSTTLTTPAYAQLFKKHTLAIDAAYLGPDRYYLSDNQSVLLVDNSRGSLFSNAGAGRISGASDLIALSSNGYALTRPVKPPTSAQCQLSIVATRTDTTLREVVYPANKENVSHSTVCGDDFQIESDGRVAIYFYQHLPEMRIVFATLTGDLFEHTIRSSEVDRRVGDIFLHRQILTNETQTLIPLSKDENNEVVSITRATPQGIRPALPWVLPRSTKLIARSGEDEVIIRRDTVRGSRYFRLQFDAKSRSTALRKLNLPFEGFIQNASPGGELFGRYTYSGTAQHAYMLTKHNKFLDLTCQFSAHAPTKVVEVYAANARGDLLVQDEGIFDGLVHYQPVLLTREKGDVNVRTRSFCLKGPSATIKGACKDAFYYSTKNGQRYLVQRKALPAGATCVIETLVKDAHGKPRAGVPVALHVGSQPWAGPLQTPLILARTDAQGKAVLHHPLEDPRNNKRENFQLLVGKKSRYHMRTVDIYPQVESN